MGGFLSPQIPPAQGTTMAAEIATMQASFPTGGRQGYDEGEATASLFVVKGRPIGAAPGSGRSLPAGVERLLFAARRDAFVTTRRRERVEWLGLHAIRPFVTTRRGARVEWLVLHPLGAFLPTPRRAAAPAPPAAAPPHHRAGR